MKAVPPHIDVDLIERMRTVFDDVVLASLLEAFIETLHSWNPELEQLPRDSVAEVRFLAIKLRGTASEYGAVRLTDVARTMEQALRANPQNVIDWRLLLSAEIDQTIRLYDQVIHRLRMQPERQSTLQLVDVA